MDKLLYRVLQMLTGERTSPVSQERSTHQEDALLTLTRQAYQAEVEKQTVYRDRNMTLSLLARLAQHLGLRVGLSRDECLSDARETVLVLDLPSGQVSWQVPDAYLSCFDDIPAYEGVWDSQTAPQKWDRVLHPDLGEHILSPTNAPTLPVGVPTGDELRAARAPTRKRRAVKKKVEEEEPGSSSQQEPS